MLRSAHLVWGWKRFSIRNRCSYRGLTHIQGGNKCHNPDFLGFSETVKHKQWFLRGSWGVFFCHCVFTKWKILGVPQTSCDNSLAQHIIYNDLGRKEVVWATRAGDGELAAGGGASRPLLSSQPLLSIIAFAHLLPPCWCSDCLSARTFLFLSLAMAGGVSFCRSEGPSAQHSTCHWLSILQPSTRESFVAAARERAC